MKISDKLKREWEKRFPGLFNEWTHWVIKGDWVFIEAVSGGNLLNAVNVVENNFGRFESIRIHRAFKMKSGDFIEQKEDFEILRYVYDKSQDYSKSE